MIKNDSNNLNFSGIGNLKYPTSRLEYSFHTGELAENVITTIVKNILPYTEIPYHNVVVNGSDLKIYYHGKLLAKFEILNFDSRSYINSKRALSIKQNLKGVKYKGVICSFFNATSRAKEILKNIPVCTIGFQLLPSKFHQYYVRLNKVHHRRIANNRSLKQLKNTLKSFFHRIGLDLLMYVSRISRTRISNTINLKNTNFNIDVKNVETENKEARTEQNTQSSTSREYTVFTISVGTVIRRLETKEISDSEPEFSPSRGKISTVSVKIKTFYNRLKISILNLLRSLWNDRSGNVELVKKSRTFVWKPRSGFQVSLNQIQTRLVRHTYPCKNKVLIFCTQKRKPRYLCKLAHIDKDDLWWYNGMLFCKCYDEDDCVQQGASCFYNMIHDLIDECPWSRTMLEEQWIFEKNLKKMMETERKKEKLKNRLRGVKDET